MADRNDGEERVAARNDGGEKAAGNNAEGYTIKSQLTDHGVRPRKIV